MSCEAPPDGKRLRDFLPDRATLKASAPRSPAGTHTCVVVYTRTPCVPRSRQREKRPAAGRAGHANAQKSAKKVRSDFLLLSFLSVDTYLASQRSHLDNPFFLYILPASVFPFSLSCFRSAVLSHFFCFGDPLFCTMYEHVVEHLSYLLAVPHSTAQRSAAQRSQPAQSRTTSTCRSECDNASKQTDLARASTCRAFIPHALSSQKRRKNRILPGLQKYATIHIALV